MIGPAYAEGLASIKRVALATANDPPNQLNAVAMLVRELAYGIGRGDLTAAELADGMQVVFSGTGMVQAHGQDALQAMLVSAFANPLDLSMAKPDGAVANGGGSAPTKSPASLVVRRASEITPRPISWLWPGRIALGKQTIIAGEPGLGKSQLTCAIAAAVTTGGGWPGNEGTAPLGSVIILSAEDDAADTIRPRLDAAGADPKRVYIVSAVKAEREGGRRSFNLQADLQLLEREIERIGEVRLVIIDPVSSYLGKVDSHKNAELRAVLEPIGEMAARHRVAVVSVTHLSKGGGGPANNRFIGSIAFVAAARAAYIVARDPDDQERRLFLPTKNNVGPERKGLGFRVGTTATPSGIVAPAIFWDATPVTLSCDEVLAASAVPADQGGAHARGEAESFLSSLLANGPVPTNTVKSEAKAAGLSWATVRRAKDQLGVAVAKTGLDDGWVWALAEDARR